jgi:hypothetical protein
MPTTRARVSRLGPAGARSAAPPSKLAAGAGTCGAGQRRHQRTWARREIAPWAVHTLTRQLKAHKQTSPHPPTFDDGATNAARYTLHVRTNSRGAASSKCRAVAEPAHPGGSSAERRLRTSAYTARRVRRRTGTHVHARAARARLGCRNHNTSPYTPHAPSNSNTARHRHPGLELGAASKACHHPSRATAKCARARGATDAPHIPARPLMSPS